MTAPFLKWVGGKGRLLKKLLPLLPSHIIGRYWEPFLGSGAVFFALQPKDAVLSDVNEPLIRTYRAVRRGFQEVMDDYRLCVKNNWSPQGFRRVVSMEPGRLNDISTAGRMLYLNRSAFNGLYRVNRAGQFNAPWGKYEKPTSEQMGEMESRLCEAELALEDKTDIRCGDFATVLEGARKGDFVYLDPPYVPISKTASFTGYQAGGFTLTDLGRLRDVCDRLTVRKVRWMLSNSDTPKVRELFDPYYMDYGMEQVNMTIITAPRAVAAKGSSRKAVKELVIRNYT